VHDYIQIQPFREEHSFIALVHGSMKVDMYPNIPNLSLSLIYILISMFLTFDYFIVLIKILYNLCRCQIFRRKSNGTVLQRPLTFGQYALMSTI
jgi:hypothetical protein